MTGWDGFAEQADWCAQQPDPEWAYAEWADSAAFYGHPGADHLEPDPPDDDMTPAESDGEAANDFYNRERNRP